MYGIFLIKVKLTSKPFEVKLQFFLNAISITGKRALMAKVQIMLFKSTIKQVQDEVQ